MGGFARPTDDLDTVLDIRTTPNMLEIFTGALIELGFLSEGRSWEGHEHRWVRGNAKVDVLIATGLGVRASLKKGVTGGTTLPTSGGQGALDRAERIEIETKGNALPPHSAP